MKLLYTEAILDGIKSIMTNQKNSIIFGLGVCDDRGLQGTTKGLLSTFGEDRVFDTPIAEDSMMGFAVGSSLAGVRTIYNHARMDFLLLTFNQLFNVATKYKYMFKGSYSFPLIVRCLVGFGWGAQHSQVLTNILSSFPGLSVVCPTNPVEAKGLLIKASKVSYPVIFVEDFQLYSTFCDVDENDFEISFDFVRHVSKGNEITLVTISSSVLQVEQYLEKNKDVSIDAFCIISPTDFNFEVICKSVKKTKKLLFVQNSWMKFGLGSEITKQLALRGVNFDYQEVGFPFCPTPFSKNLEKEYYVNLKKLHKSINSLISNKRGSM